jgi:hypothetical protein
VKVSERFAGRVEPDLDTPARTTPADPDTEPRWYTNDHPRRGIRDAGCIGRISPAGLKARH